MGFLDNKKDNSAPRDSAYLDIPGDGNKKVVRPSAKTPQTVWVHKIHRVEETTASGEGNLIRRYSTVACTSTGRGGTNCAFCTTPDPLWSKLPADSQNNRKGSRVDFPKTAIHVMPVYDHDLKAIKIMKGGNQLYESMDQWFDLQRTDSEKDLRRCDWSVWKSGKGVKTQYAAARLDPTPFDFGPDIELASKQAIDKAMLDLRVPADKIRETMYGEAGDASLQPTAPQVSVINPSPAPVQAQVQAPAPFEPSSTPVFVPNPPVAAPVTQVAAPNQNDQQIALKGFIDWVSKQPEFAGAGMVQTLIPFVREHLNGEINYHKLNAVQMSELHMFLAGKLNVIRAGK